MSECCSSPRSSARRGQAPARGAWPHALGAEELSREPPEGHGLALVSNLHVTTFTVASNEFVGGGKEKSEYHPVVAWD